MSNVKIKRLVENIRANTTVYTPLIEIIVNAIQAIDETGRSDGGITVRVERDGQRVLDGALPEIIGFAVEDNGIGFTDRHRNSFDTLYSDTKILEGGKGFGRFTALKYFNDVHVLSTYRSGDAFMERRFQMGKDTEIIVGEKIEKASRESPGSTVFLKGLKKEIDKTIPTIARNLVERLLPYFITQDYACPEIIVCEMDGSDAIRLNDFVRNELSGVIREVQVGTKGFALNAVNTEENFAVRVFKIYSPRNQKSKISLVAHKREVTGSPIHKYVPEFEDEFYDKDMDGESQRERNYIVRAYVFGTYLDQNVSVERGGFEFHMDSDLMLGISQSDIEREAAHIAKQAVGAEVTSRQERKKERVYAYVEEEAPWHKAILGTIDLNGMPNNPTNEQIEARLQREKFSREESIRSDVKKLLARASLGNAQEDVADIVDKLSDTSKNDLIHYVALRRKILDIFGKSLETDENGAYSSEGIVHDIIFPRRSDTERTYFHEHNLWIVDERLNFTSYVSSDIATNKTDRPDLLVYNKRIVFRGENEPSNPVTIFEFKKPQRDDFANPSSSEDPVQQIVRYVNSIRDGQCKTPEGRQIRVAKSTPFYGYVVCDLTPKVETWLDQEKNFTPMPDGMGWFHWMSNINLYVEVLSWEKVLKDAKMRNQIFFHKLGIL